MQLNNDLYEFISSEVGINRKKLLPSTKLREDIGLDADDAFELLQKFSERYDVDMSNFNFSTYFSKEGTELLFALLFLLRIRKPVILKSLNIADLEIAIKKGFLI